MPGIWIGRRDEGRAGVIRAAIQTANHVGDRAESFAVSGPATAAHQPFLETVTEWAWPVVRTPANGAMTKTIQIVIHHCIASRQATLTLISTDGAHYIS